MAIRAARGLRAGMALALTLLLAGTAEPAAAAGTDLGDAPPSFDLAGDVPARASLAGPRLGSAATADAADPETGVSVHASETATDDPGDDGLAEAGELPVGRLIPVSRTVTVSQVTAPARLCGWVDFDLSGDFGPAERTCAVVPGGADRVRLDWLGRPRQAGTSYLRLRLGDAVAAVDRPTGDAGPGEVEDYAVRFVPAGPGPRPALVLQETVHPDRVRRAGEPLQYTFVARNTGDVPLTGVRVSDELPGLSPLDCEPGGPAALDPGAALRCTATRTVTQGDLDFGTVDDVSEATGEAPQGDPEDPSDDVTAVAAGEVVAVQRPRLSLRAASPAVSGRVGQRVRISFVARNSGNVTVTDDRLAVQGASSGCAVRQSLAPGQVRRCAVEVRLTRRDLRRGALTVRALTRAERPYGDPGTRSDDVVARASVRIPVRAAAHPPGQRPGPGESPGSPPAAGAAATARLPDMGGPPLGVGLVGALLLAAGLLALAVRSRVDRRRGRPD